MLCQFSELSIWEISHYWHNHNPDSTKPKSLPVEVQSTMRVLAAASSGALYFRCPPNSLYYLALKDGDWAARAFMVVFQRELRKAYRHRRFNKKFFDGLTISRTALAKWCWKTKTPFPEFWFPPDDPLTKVDLDKLDDLPNLSQDGKLALFPMFTKTTQSPVPPEAVQTAGSSLEGLMPSKKKILEQEISRIATQNALAKYQSLHELKRNFIRFYYQNGFTNRSEAARQFFVGLTGEEQRALVPTRDNDSPGVSSPEAKAVRTLTDAFREYQNEKPAAWLEGFIL